MKTITIKTLKNTYAQEQGYEDWGTFLNYYGCRHPEWFDQHWTVICIRAQKIALEKVAENATMLFDAVYDWHSVNKESIINENNLIR